MVPGHDRIHRKTLKQSRTTFHPIIPDHPKRLLLSYYPRQWKVECIVLGKSLGRLIRQ